MCSDRCVVTRSPSVRSRLWPASSNWNPHRNSVRVLEDISYSDSQQLDLFLPLSAQSTTPWVLFIHGGVWRTQGRKLFRAWSGLYSNIGAMLARNGIAAAIAGYRQGTGYSIRDSLEDLNSAINLVKHRSADWQIAPDQFVIAGHSGGGHLALALSNSIRPSGVISLAGFYDCARFEATLAGKSLAGFKFAFDGCRDNPAIWNPGQEFAKRPLPLLLGISEQDPESLRIEYEELSKSLAPISTFEVKSCGHMGLVLEIGSLQDVIGPLLVDFIHRVTSNPQRAAEPKP